MDLQVSQAIRTLRFPLAAMVVLLHSNIYYRLPVSADKGVYDIVTIVFSGGICLVAVPTFFFISGFLFFQNKNKPIDGDFFKNKFSKRVHSLLIPYLLWNLIAFASVCAYWFVFSYYKNQEFRSLYSLFTENGGVMMFWNAPGGKAPIDFPLWFIRDLMATILLSPVIYLLIRWLSSIAVLLLVVIINIPDLWPIDNGVSHLALSYFIMGGFYGIKRRDFIKDINVTRPVNTVLLIIGIVTIVASYGRYGFLCNLAQSFIRIPMVFLIFDIAIKLPVSHKKFWGKLENVSFFIFAVHTIYVRDISMILVRRIVPPINDWMNVLGYFLSAIFMVVISVLIFRVLNSSFPKASKILTGKN